MNPRRTHRNLSITRDYLAGFTSQTLARSHGLSSQRIRDCVRETCRFLNEPAYVALSPGQHPETADLLPPRLDSLKSNAHAFLAVADGC